MYCLKCGNKIEEGNRFCEVCGSPVQQNNGMQMQPNMQMQSGGAMQPNMQMQMGGAMQPNRQKSKKTVWIIAGTILIVAIVVAAIFLAKILFFDKNGLETNSGNNQNNQQVVNNSEKDNTEDKQNDDSADNNQDTEVANVSVDVESILNEQLQTLISEKNDIRNIVSDVCVGQEVEKTNGVIGAIIMDISGDGVDDLVVAYTENDSINADVYTVEENVIKCKAKRLFDIQGLSSYEPGLTIGGVYLIQTTDGWNLVAESSYDESIQGDGISRVVKSVLCTNHGYAGYIDYNYIGSDYDDTESQKVINESKKLGMSGVTEAMMTTFFQQYTDVIMVGAFHTETTYFASYYEMYDGDEYATFYVDNVNGPNNKPDTTAARRFADDYNEYYENAQNEWQNIYVDNDEYILPQSNMRELTEEDLYDIIDDEWMRKMARNEIFARYGRRFKDEQIQAYFDSKEWYEPVYDPDEFDEDVESIVSKMEMQNSEFIKTYEKRLKEQ